MSERIELAGISGDLPEGFDPAAFEATLPSLESLLPPEWLRPAPVDAGEMRSLAEGLLVETVLAVADGTVDEGMGHAAFSYLSDVLERDIGALMAEDWPVYQALQGVAGVLNVIKPLGDEPDERPEVVRFVGKCCEEAARHRAGEPMRAVA